MKKILFLAFMFSACAFADDLNASFVRLKSGFNLPVMNSNVSHYTPIALDGIYHIPGTGWGVGAELMYTGGSHGFTTFQGGNTASFNLTQSLFLPLAAVNYVFEFGSARVSAGLKAGGLFYWDRTALVSGFVTNDSTSSNTVFTGGPSLDLDLPLKGAFFVNVGGDYLFTPTTIYNFGSLYVGLGMNL